MRRTRHDVDNRIELPGLWGHLDLMHHLVEFAMPSIGSESGPRAELWLAIGFDLVSSRMSVALFLLVGSVLSI